MIVTNYNIWIYFRILIEIQFTKKKKKTKIIYDKQRCIKQ